MSRKTMLGMPTEIDHPALAPLLCNAKQAAVLCGVSKATWHRMVSAGRTPAPLRLSGGCVRWRVSELREWTEIGCPGREEWLAIRGEDQKGNGLHR
jgi:predicted DNA-binding transcriptional regulator AlpA